MFKLRTALALAFALIVGVAAAQQSLTFWTSLTYPIDVEALQTIVDEFNAANPDLEVELVQVPGSDVNDVSKLMTAVAGGTGPDIYMLDRFTVAQRAAAGLLTDLGDRIDSGAADAFLEFAWNEVLFQGDAYGVPFDTDVRALYYNRDMIDAAGVDASALDPANGVPSLEDVERIAQALNETDDQGNYTQVGFIPWVGQGQPYTWGFAFGGDFYDEAACRLTPDSEEIVASMAWVDDWAGMLGRDEIVNYISTFSSGAGPIAWSGQIPPAQNPFITGRLGMVAEGDWFVANLERYAPDMEFGVTYLPSPTGEVASWSGGWAMVMPTGTEDEDAAYRFIEHITGTQGQRTYAEMTSHFPTRAELLEDDAIYEGRRAFLRTILDGSHARPALPVGGQYWGELRGAQEETVLDRMAPEEALERVVSRVQPRLDEYCD